MATDAEKLRYFDIVNTFGLEETANRGPQFAKTLALAIHVGYPGQGQTTCYGNTLEEVCRSADEWLRARHELATDGAGSTPDIPRDKNFPADAVQCDQCGGLGINMGAPGPGLKDERDGPGLKDPDCSVCEGRGWLEAGHPKGRKCHNEECNKPLPPDRYQVYCSNDCAIEDA